MGKVKLVKTAAKPKCPHCGKELETVAITKAGYSIFSTHTIYSCPHCQKVLSVGGSLR